MCTRKTVGRQPRTSSSVSALPSSGSVRGGRGNALLGTPEEIIARLKRLEAGGVEHVLFAAPGASVAGLRTFAEEIMPAFDREPMALAQV